MGPEYSKSNMEPPRTHTHGHRDLNMSPHITYWSRNSFWQLKWGWEEWHLQKRQPVATLPHAVPRLLHKDSVFFPNRTIYRNFLGCWTEPSQYQVQQPVWRVRNASPIQINSLRTAQTNVNRLKFTRITLFPHHFNLWGLHIILNHKLKEPHCVCLKGIQIKATRFHFTWKTKWKHKK